MIVKLRMLFEYLCYPDSHRAVEKDRQLRYPAFLQKFTEIEQYLLRTLERKARNYDIAASFDGRVDNLGDCLFNVSGGTVVRRTLAS